MGNPFIVIRGSKLSKIGLWFFLTYAYSKYVEPKEERYKKRSNYNLWCNEVDQIINNDIATAREWVQYAINKLEKSTYNKGHVSFNDQKKFAKKLEEIF